MSIGDFLSILLGVGIVLAFFGLVGFATECVRAAYLSRNPKN